MAGGRDRRSARGLLQRRAVRATVRERPTLGRPERPSGWQPTPVDRNPGEIIVPRDGAVVGGVVAVAGRAARTGWGVRAIELEVARGGGEWQRGAVVALSEAAVVLRVSGGFREEVAIVRSNAVAHVLAAELAELDGSEYVVDRAARRPWATDSWSADWDTTSLEDGAYDLRVVTVDMAGARTVSPTRRVMVTARTAREDLLDRRRGLDDLWQRLTVREAELVEREAAVVSREAPLAELERELTARRADVERAEAALAAATAEVERREQSVAELAREQDRIRADAADLERRAAAVAARERAAAAVSARAQQLDAEVVELERLRAEHTAAAEALAAREARVADLEPRLADLDRREAAHAAAASELERRQQIVVQRETATASAAAEIARRERELATRTNELEQALAEHATAAASLAERDEAMTQREAAIAGSDPLLRDLARRAVEPAPPPPPAEPAPAPAAPPAVVPPAPPLQPAPQPAPRRPEPVTAGGAGLSLWVLESRVAASPHADAATQAEREATLYALRDYADAGGRIPAQFEQMVRDVFGELV
jgi:hypothetical protein